MRYFLNLSYKGTNFHGWQKQPNANTVQEEIEKAISTILRTPISIMGSGRTDAKVHAKEQYAHFDTDVSFNKEELEFKLNSFLPKDISINAILEVKPDAHTRFDALSRTYHYKINQNKNPFLQNLSSFYSKEKFDIDFLNELAKEFVGNKDFQSFARIKSEVNHFGCDVTKAHWFYQDDLLVFEIKANRFLRGMVRAIVGTMVDITNHKIEANQLKTIFESKNRRQAGQAAKPEGLYLTKVEYPEEIF